VLIINEQTSTMVHWFVTQIRREN